VTVGDLAPALHGLSE